MEASAMDLLLNFWYSMSQWSMGGKGSMIYNGSKRNGSLVELLVFDVPVVDGRQRVNDLQWKQAQWISC